MISVVVMEADRRRGLGRDVSGVVREGWVVQEEGIVLVVAAGVEVVIGRKHVWQCC